MDNVPANIWAGLDGLFWHRAASPALTIWYLFVLFVLSLATLWLLNGKPGRSCLRLLAASLLPLPRCPCPADLYANRVFTYAPSSCWGRWPALPGARWDELLDRFGPFALAMLLAGLVCVAVWGQGEEQKAVMLPLGASPCQPCTGALQRVRFDRLRAALLFFGRYGFMICRATQSASASPKA